MPAQLRAGTVEDVDSQAVLLLPGHCRMTHFSHTWTPVHGHAPPPYAHRPGHC